MIQAELIQKNFGTSLTYLYGNLQRVAERVSRVEGSDTNALIFVSNKDQLEIAISRGFSILVLDHKLEKNFSGEILHATKGMKTEPATFVTDSISLAMSQLLPLFDGKMNRFHQEERVHPLSYVHPSAHLGANVRVGPFCFVGEGAVVGAHSTLGSHVVLECHSKVGDYTLIHPHVFVGAQCEIGSHCEIHPHTTIGSDGYGYAVDRVGDVHKIPQLGKVIVGDHVEIGSGCAIDRATLDATRVGKGTKIDNLCHIAHNCEIGESCFITAGFFVAGSSRIGNRFQTGGNSVVRDHVKIADNVTLAGRSTVTQDILEGGAYGGYPVQTFKEHLRTIANLGELNRLRKELSALRSALRSVLEAKGQ